MNCARFFLVSDCKTNLRDLIALSRPLKKLYLITVLLKLRT